MGGVFGIADGRLPTRRYTGPVHEERAAHPDRPLSTLGVIGWAAYLACSWTWCIGMFLPILLIRDFGAWGFLAFAAPNVVGAALMGFVLTSHQSREIAHRHHTAGQVFSAVTIAFQLVFLFTIATMFFGPETARLYIFAAGGAAAAAIAIGLKERGAVLLWAASVIVLTLSWRQSGWALPNLRLDNPPPGLLWLAPVCMFGFALCPYLDLTFHHARRQSGDVSGRKVFALGFGVLFLVMILGTVTYATRGLNLMNWPARAVVVPGAMLIGAHIAMQAQYTVLLHLPAVYKGRHASWFVAVMLLAVIAGIGAAYEPWEPTRWGMSVGEVTYRLFLAAYGLVFPAYVWLCMIPTRDGHSGTAGPAGRRKLTVLCAAVVLAAPCYWMGFVMKETWWLGVGLGVVLAARGAVRLSGSQKPARSP